MFNLSPLNFLENIWRFYKICIYRTFKSYSFKIQAISNKKEDFIFLKFSTRWRGSNFLRSERSEKWREFKMYLLRGDPLKNNFIDLKFFINFFEKKQCKYFVGQLVYFVTQETKCKSCHNISRKFRTSILIWGIWFRILVCLAKESIFRIDCSILEMLIYCYRLFSIK